jgi:serine/threonine protein kinase
VCAANYQPFLSEGALLGKYRIVRHLAVGGMAELYLARWRGPGDFEKLVALKRVLPQFAADDVFVRMFLAEARLGATLHHSNIVQLYDFGVADGNYFYTMEYVEGADLRTVMKSARRLGLAIPLECAVQIVSRAAAGLHHAHEAPDSSGEALGLVHRDVSPSNVLLSASGDVKIADFGIAKATVTHTAGTSFKGKVQYMSPEQCRGDVVDHRSDIFSLGILLYELTTGRRLFAASNEVAAIRKILDDPLVPPSSLDPDYPRDLEVVVMRALARDRDARFQTAEDLQLALECFARDHKLLASSVTLARFVERLVGSRRRTRTPPAVQVPASSPSDGDADPSVATERDPGIAFPAAADPGPFPTPVPRDSGTGSLSGQLATGLSRIPRPALFGGAAAALVGIVVLVAALDDPSAPAAEAPAARPAAPSPPAAAPATRPETRTEAAAAEVGTEPERPASEDPSSPESPPRKARAEQERLDAGDRERAEEAGEALDPDDIATPTTLGVGVLEAETDPARASEGAIDRVSGAATAPPRDKTPRRKRKAKEAWDRKSIHLPD